MSITLKRDGLYVGIDPGTRDAYANRSSAGAWEQFTATKHQQWYDLKADVANLQLAVNEQTKQLEARPAGDIDGWGGQWEIAKDASGGWTATCDKHTFQLDGFKIGMDGGPVQGKPLHLEKRGNDFVDAQGNRIVFPGVDAFPAFRMFRDGGQNALQALVDESVRLGFRVWRIWSQGDKGQNNTVTLSPKEPGYYNDVGAFTTFLNANGIIPLWTAFVDNQVVLSPVEHWLRLIDAATGGMALFSGYNQWSKNKSTFGPWDLPSPPAGVIWSRGSDTDDVMTNPKGAPAGELHATRISFERALMDSTASPPTMRKPENGYGMIWMTEGNPFGDAKGYTENQAWKLGRAYSIEWSVAIFHNRQSQFGKLMNEDTARCAAAWVKGMRLE